MSDLVDKLSGYARYHRDPRNLVTHMFGVPMILLGTAALLSRPGLAAAPHLLNPAVLTLVVLAAYYLRIDRRLGLVITLLLVLLALLGRGIADMAMPIWLGLGFGLLLVGWVLQLWGHAFEGRKPAFLDDIQQLLIGPLFVVAEIGFRLGRGQRLRAATEQRAGPARLSIKEPQPRAGP